MRRVALIGGGVIGSGWAASCLAQDLEVRVFDPAPEAEESMPRDSRLSFAGTIEDAVRDADFVQENGPEREDVKAEIIREIDLAARPHVVVASSSSTMMPSTLAAMAPEHPERVLVGHPFNPVRLMPLVEVVGGPGTSPAAVEAALRFYRSLGKRPVHLRREVAGHLANRLQAALWREAYSLVESGVASVADVDAAIAHGPGLRWALLGPLVNQHLSGGAGGLAHVLAHLGPPTQAIMDDLGDPRLSPELVDLLVRGVDDELAGVDQAAMAAARDELLVGLLTAKAQHTDLP
ncbi:3-hydroxyacyl-CoA dehydrogenase NAD-binding domain-containing protein [Nocardioides sp. SR21]|uniref:3-hydroxyacyl-CoA dehydrogenase NAD-binding domain-containing protein n=1 Tax=Nocardioides sp. SR21 TaxID=2919501 RepID=UPI001FA95105|nr:3-hydroxyacyl-CoA dehydrogenase NAD-binding domain-containing protein [Nocardioides sp. SR21]